MFSSCPILAIVFVTNEEIRHEGQATSLAERDFLIGILGCSDRAVNGGSPCDASCCGGRACDGPSSTPQQSSSPCGESECIGPEHDSDGPSRHRPAIRCKCPER